MRNLLVLPLLLLLLTSCAVGGRDYQKGLTAYNSSDYAAALDIWTPLAEQGHPFAQYNLGLMSYHGIGIPQNYDIAAQWYNLAANQGLWQAQRKLASERGFAGAYANLDWEYRYKDGVRQNNNHISIGDLYAAMNTLASVERDTQRYGTTLRELTPLAEMGDAEAQAKLSLRHFWGDGVPRHYIHAYMWGDIAASNGSETGADNRDTAATKMPPADIIAAKALAAECIDKSYKDCLPAAPSSGLGPVTAESARALRELTSLAQQGDAKAQNNLGSMYRLGADIPQDYEIAMGWFRLAAEQGDAEGQNNLGWMYRFGTGVPTNYEIALKWFRLAAEQGDTEGRNNLGWMYRQGTGVPRSYAIATEWYRLAADQGDARAQNSLGELYRLGERNYRIGEHSIEWSVPQDYRAAMEWFKLASQQGYSAASYNLGSMYSNGQGVPRDGQIAIKWYKLAAKQGYARGYESIGSMYLFGWEVPQDDAIAKKWYALYGEHGSAYIKNDLGEKYLRGTNFPQDDKSAAKWFKASAEMGYARAQINLGAMYFWGAGGLPQDYIYAYMWGNIFASFDSGIVRDAAERQMTLLDISAAQKRTYECVAKDYKGC